MAEAICDTSPFQYLYQLDLLEILPRLIGTLIVPPAVIDELSVGRALGLDLPAPEMLPWVDVRTPSGKSILPLETDLGKGEASVLALALENPGMPVVLDDALARRMARQ